MEHTFTRICTALVAFFALMWLVALAHEPATDQAARDAHLASTPSR